MKKRTLVIGNWKMELSHAASIELARALKKALPDAQMHDVDVAVCPSFAQLPAVSEQLAGTTSILVGAQDVHFLERGAWTGAVSVQQIKGLASICIVGHSERRALLNETDEQIKEKVLLLLKHKLVPVVCVGESQDERDQGKTIEKVTGQVLAVLEYVRMADLPHMVFAYEPIWAIGTGQVCDPAEASSVMLLIRKLAAERFGPQAAERLRVIYGGSVSPKNIEECMREPGIDGVLVGGASVHPGDFTTVVAGAKRQLSD